MDTLRKRSRIWLGLGVLVAGLAAGAGQPEAAEAAVCTKTWAAGAGSWGVGSNWSPAGVPGAGDNVCIGAGGIVTLSASTTVANLDITAADAVLDVEGNGGVGSVALTVTTLATNAGTLGLTSVGGGWGSTLTGDLVNTGTFISRLGSGGPRTYGGILTTSGTVTVDRALSLGASTITNTGTVTLNANISDGSSAITFNQNGGSITGTGTLFLSSDTFNYNSGAVSAANRLTHVALATSGAAVGVATLTTRGGSTLTGTVAGSTTVVALGDGAIGSTTLTVTSGAVNNGVISLTSEGGGWGSTLTTPGLTNNASLTSDVGTGGPRTLSGTISNSGTLTINQPTTQSGLTFTNTGSLVLNASLSEAGLNAFTQTSGSITGTGTLFMRDDTFVYTTGAVTVPNRLWDSALTTSGSATGGATFTLRGGSLSSLTGTVSPSTTVVVLGDGSAGAGLLTIASGAVNNGTIIATSEGGGWQSHITSPGFTNNATISTEVGTAGPRRLSGTWTNSASGTITINTTSIQSGLTLTNAGTVTLNADLSEEFTNTINQNAGAIAGTGTLFSRADTFNYSGGTVTAPNRLWDSALTVSGTAPGGTLTVRGNFPTIAGVVSPGTTIVVLGDGSAGAATLTSAAGITNNGVITLTSEGGGWGSAVVFGGTGLDNNGALNFNVGTAGPRTYTGHLVNDGTVTVNTNTTFSTTDGVYTNNAAFTVAAGTVSSTGLNQTFTQAGGALDVTAGAMALRGVAFNFNGGTIPGTNLVIWDGSTTLGPSATGAATITIRGGAPTLTGDVKAATTLNVRGDGSSGLAILTAAAPVTNAGTINLTDTGGAWGATFNANGGLTNNGTLASLDGSGGSRNLGGALTNGASGVFTVNRSLSMSTAGAAHSNAGTITIVDGPDTLTVGGVGATLLNNGAIGGLGTLVLSSNVAMSGTGSATNTLLTGTSSVNPGTSPGTMAMTSNFVVTGGTAVNIELGGPGAGVGYDRLNVTVNATFTNGTLNVTTISGFVPCNGAVYDVIEYGTRTGTFSAVNAPTGMTVTYLPNLLRLTSTTGPACQPGGKGIDINASTGGINLTWDGGGNQESYSLLRYNTVTTASDLLLLPANAVSHSHTTAANNVVYCYLLAANGAAPTVLGLSDLLCGMKGMATGSVQAGDFTLTLDQTTSASLTWTAPPGGVTSYLLQRIPLDGSAPTPIALGAGVTSSLQSVPAAGMCFQLVGFNGPAFGTTNVICGLPGFSTLSGASLGQVLAAVETALAPLSRNGLQAIRQEGRLD